MTPLSTSSEELRRRTYRREIYATLLLSLATVGSTWCAYESARWSGRQATRFSEASGARTKSEGAATRAVQLTALDAGMFLQYAAAYADGRVELVRFLHDRFRPEMKVALDAWLATDPLRRAGAPPSPFAMPQYSLEASRLSTQFADKADATFAAARAANVISDKYVLLTVVFTSVLFFASVSQKLWSPMATRILLGMASLLFVGATAAMIVLPLP
jgi:hypothetical protein